MHICHVTPHLPPDQAANALLPAHLGRWAADAGHGVSYVAHPPRAGAPEPVAGRVTWIEPAARGWLHALGVGSIASAARIARRAGPSLAEADLVHVHSNGLLADVCAALARRRNRPVVLTLYGTEIWHYQPKPWPRDLFTKMYRRAAHVTFYSRGLLDKAIELGLSREHADVVYPPVVDRFQPVSDAERAALRARLGLRARHVLLNVKRLHPLAGQQHLIDAMPRILARHPDTELVICGMGPLLPELQARAAAAGVADRVRFAGLVDNSVVADYNRAADAFILPSLLEALPTVAVEALACGTPVISADHPGGVELHALFDADVAVVPKERADALADAIGGFLDRPRRTLDRTADVLSREFRPRAVWQRFHAIYERHADARTRTTDAPVNERRIGARP